MKRVLVPDGYSVEIFGENYVVVPDDLAPLLNHNLLANLTVGDPHTQYIYTQPASSGRNTVSPANDVVSLVFNEFSGGQTANFIEINNKVGGTIFYVSSTGGLGVYGSSIFNANVTISSGNRLFLPSSSAGVGTITFGNDYTLDFTGSSLEIRHGNATGSTTRKGIGTYQVLSTSGGTASGRLFGFQFLLQGVGANAATSGLALTGIEGTCLWSGTGTMAGAVGSLVRIDADSGGTLTNGYGYYVLGVTASGSSHITNAYGIFFDSSAFSAITANNQRRVGIFFSSAMPNPGSFTGTRIYNIWVGYDSTSPRDGIAFGANADVELYRKGGGVLGVTGGAEFSGSVFSDTYSSFTTGGSVTITAKAPVSGNGGNITIAPPTLSGLGVTAGSVIIRGGNGALGATAGAVRIQNPGGTNRIEVNATGIGFFGVTPVAQNTGWSVTSGYTATKSFNPETATLLTVARVLGTLVDALKSYGILG
jgi:hypothetical protein